MARTEEQRRKATEAMRRWRAKNPPKPLTEEQRVKMRSRWSAWAKKNPDKKKAIQRRSNKKGSATRPWSRSLGVRQAHAKKRGIPFTLKVADVRAVWTGKCALTGFPFDLRASTPARPLPKYARGFSPSLDRIKPEIGYVPGNIRFVLHCVNMFKGTMRDALMKRVAARLC